MHMADALLSPAVGGTLWAASAGTIAHCSAKVRKELDERRVPLMGVLGAFLFAAQMIFATLLHRTTRQVDLLLCSPFASRDRAELEGLIGYFNNIVVMRADLSNDPPFRELLGRVRRLSLEASDHQKFPLQRVAELPNLVRVPLTRGMFCYHDFSARRLDLPGVTATPIDIRKETADFDLALYMQTETDGQLAGILEYNTELFADETIDRLLRDFETVLACVAKEPETRLSQLPRFGPQSADIQARLAGRHRNKKC